MTEQTRPMPDVEALASLAAASMACARSLLEDARLLLKNERWPRAYALAVLALEEVGKASVCTDAADFPDAAEDFWVAFADHNIKLERAHVLPELVNPQQLDRDPADVISELIGDSKASNTTKFRGLYTEYKRGQIIRPEKQVTETLAQRVVKQAGDLIELVAPDFESPNLATALAARVEARRPQAERLHSTVDEAPLIGPGVTK